MHSVYSCFGKIAGRYGPLEEVSLGDLLSPAALRASAEGIKVIPEGRDDSPELQTCQQLLQEADAIVYLGFSFDQTNMARLNADETSRGRIVRGPGVDPYRPIAATAYGLTKAEITKIRTKYNFEKEAALLPMKSLELLRESLILG